MSEKDVIRVSQIWRDAENILQDGDQEEAERLKAEWADEISTLSRKDQRSVLDEIEGFGG